MSGTCESCGKWFDNILAHIKSCPEWERAIPRSHGLVGCSLCGAMVADDRAGRRLAAHQEFQRRVGAAPATQPPEEKP